MDMQLLKIFGYPGPEWHLENQSIADLLREYSFINKSMEYKYRIGT